MVYFNDIFALIMEVISVVLLVTWAYSLPNIFWQKLILAIFALIIFGVIWGLFFSPKANYIIPGKIIWFLKFGMLIFPYLKFLKSKPMYIGIGGILIATNLIIQATVGRGNW